MENLFIKNFSCFFSASMQCASPQIYLPRSSANTRTNIKKIPLPFSHLHTHRWSRPPFSETHYFPSVHLSLCYIDMSFRLAFVRWHVHVCCPKHGLTENIFVFTCDCYNMFVTAIFKLTKKLHLLYNDIKNTLFNASNISGQPPLHVQKQRHTSPHADIMIYSRNVLRGRKVWSLCPE